MKFNYKFEEKDFAYYLKTVNRKYNYICLLLFTIFYFGACLDLITTNTSQVLISYVVSICILFSLLKVVTLLFAKIMILKNNKTLDFAYGTYKVEINDEMVREVLDDKTFELKYEDIYRISKNDKWLILYPKNSKIMFIFIKKAFEKEDVYQKCVHMILEHYNHVQTGTPLKVKKEKPKKNLKKVRNKKAK
jgi:hypothetical protein